MSEEPLDASGLRSLLTTILAGAVGENHTTWAKLVGEVEVLPIVFNPRCNWSVKPKGTSAQREAIAKAVELVRAEHPYIRANRPHRDGVRCW